MQAAALTGVGVGAAFRLSVFDTDDTRAAISWALDSPVPEDAEGTALRIAARLSGAGPQARLNTGVVANADRLLAHATDADPGFEGAILAGLTADALFIDGDLAQARSSIRPLPAGRAIRRRFLARRQHTAR